MEEKEIINELFKDLYSLQQRYFYIPLNDYLWEHLVREAGELGAKYKQRGELISNLARELINALLNYKDKREQTEAK